MSRDNSQTRDRILNAALELLEASRGKGVRMTDIAQKAGVSRQALYLHFDSRTELLIATTLYLDELKGGQQRLARSREATSGVERLDAFIEAWTHYIPEIYSVAKVILAMLDTDEAAAAAWEKRMGDMREGCEAAIVALDRDGMLTPELTPSEATDILSMLLSVRNWEQLTQKSNWSQSRYTAAIQSLAHHTLVERTRTPPT